MKNHTFYSLRSGSNPSKDGFPFDRFKDLFLRIFNNFSSDGYFDESFGSWCVDTGHIPGKITDIELEILLKIRKNDLWPISKCINNYNEDDLFDIIEFLFIHISKPVDGNYHSWNECGMHWETFDKTEGQKEFRQKINEILEMYIEDYELSDNGEVLSKPDIGFERIFEADIPSRNKNVADRINAAIRNYRQHKATLDDRRQAVRDLADVLEYLKPKVKSILTKKDENDLFNIANNFGIRHHNKKQKTNYDTGIWLSWMFYFYLATIHVILRKIDNEKIEL